MISDSWRTTPTKNTSPSEPFFKSPITVLWGTDFPFKPIRQCHGRSVVTERPWRLREDEKCNLRYDIANFSYWCCRFFLECGYAILIMTNIYVLSSLFVPVCAPVLIADILKLAKTISNDTLLSMYTWLVGLEKHLLLSQICYWTNCVLHCKSLNLLYFWQLQQ